MARYGHCSACGTSVWLAGDGSCPNGHGPEFISGIVDDGAPAGVAQPPAAPQQKSNKTVLIVVGVLVALMLCGCGVIFAGPVLFGALGIGVPVFNAASESAQEQTCFSNQRTMEGALMQWQASDPANTPDSLYDTSSAISVLVPDYLTTEPLCPGDGWYEYDPYAQTFTCTVHGHF